MTDLEKQELLAEAKRRYPIGCKIISNQDSTGYIDSNEIRFGINTKEKIYANNGDYELYNTTSKKWAEIISYPENYKPQPEFQIELIL